MAERLTIEQREGLRFASVMARKGVTATRIGEALGLAIAEGPRVSGDADLALIGTGPGTWLALGSIEALRARLESLASLSDQSGGYAVFRLSGEGARTVLQRGAAIDFHPSAFATGSVATTVIAHIGVIIWQVDDQPAYDGAVFRSYADSFRHWLDLAAAAL